MYEQLQGRSGHARPTLQHGVLGPLGQRGAEPASRRVNVCMVDGSVHFVTNSIDINLWQALISADGGELVSFGE